MNPHVLTNILRMKSGMLTLLTLGVLVFGASQARADQITITETASSASGFSHLGDFFDATVTVTFVGDTSNVLSSSSCPSPISDTFCIVSPIFAGTTTIKIGGVGTFTFADATYAFVNQTDGIAGIVDSSTVQAVLDTVSSSFQTYDLMSSIGPLSGEALSAFGGIDAETTEGQLHLQFLSSTTSTYTATIAGTTAVPEPSSLLLLGTVLPGLAMLRRRARSLNFSLAENNSQGMC